MTGNVIYPQNELGLAYVNHLFAQQFGVNLLGQITINKLEISIDK